MTGQAQEPPDLDAVTDLLNDVGGECAHCKELAEQRVAVALVPGNSGPGYTVYGCIPCAKQLARYAMAPEWLKLNVARLVEGGL